MNYEFGKRQLNMNSRVLIVLVAIFIMPMASSMTANNNSLVTAKEPDSSNTVDAAAVKNTPYPQVFKTDPMNQSIGVDPSLDEITVTFDRDMQKGMSWTGGKKYLPPTNKKKKPYWKDSRTCVLPVKLKKGKYYRVGLNSKRFMNFRAVNGKPTPPVVLSFVTKGASKSVERYVQIPKIVKMTPKNGEEDVDSSLTTITVTFDVPMGKGMSWTGGGPSFPESIKGKRARWSRDGKTCTLPVRFKPDTDYKMGLNSLSHNNFQSKWGLPLKAVVYEFSTGGSK